MGFIINWYIEAFLTVNGYSNPYVDIILKFNRYFRQLFVNVHFDALMKIIWVVGFMMMLMYFFGDMSEKAATNQLSTLIVGKSFAYLILAAFLTYHVKDIFILMINISDALNNQISAVAGEAAAQKNINFNKILTDKATYLLFSRCISNYFSFLEQLGYFFRGLLLHLADYATRVILIYISASRTIELFLYYLFAPIGISDIFEVSGAGTLNPNSSGIIYLKKAFSIMLQLAVFTAATHMSGALTKAVYNQQRYESTIQGLKENGFGGVADFITKTIKKDNVGSDILEGIFNGFTDAAAKVKLKASVETLRYTPVRGPIITQQWMITKFAKTWDSEETSEEGKNGIIYIGNILDENGNVVAGNKRLYDAIVANTSQVDEGGGRNFDGSMNFDNLPVSLQEMYLMDNNTSLTSRNGKFVVKEVVDEAGTWQHIFDKNGKDLTAQYQSITKNEAPYYHMTVDSTETFLNYIIGNKGQGIVFYILLMASNVLLIHIAVKVSEMLMGV